MAVGDLHDRSGRGVPQGAVRVQGCPAGEPVGMVCWDAGVFEGVTVRCESALRGDGVFLPFLRTLRIPASK